MKELFKRSLTGLIYGLLMAGSVIIHPLAFFTVYLAVAILCLNEFFKLSEIEEAQPHRLSGLAVGAAVFTILFILNYTNSPKEIILIIPSLIIGVLILELFRKKARPFLNLAFFLMGLIYIILPLGLISKLTYSPYSGSYSFQLFIFLLMILWVNDTGAYLFGSLLGKHKLFVRLSPKKTWEGLFGGFATAFIIMAIFGKFFKEIPTFDQWIITAIIIIFGTFGDLFESMWKRSLGIKDSGNVLPGHGGWLDRLDSILFAVPAVFITVLILNAA